MPKNSRNYTNIRRSRDRGSHEFRSLKHKKEGNVMYVATSDVVTTHPENSIKNVSKLMCDSDFRRLPVTDAGTNRLEGLAVAMGILDFLGGGEKYNIIVKDYGGNFLKAINSPIGKIMREPSYIESDSSISDAIHIMLTKKTSAIPIVDDKENKRVVALVTERDVLPITDSLGATVGQAMQEKPITATPGMMLSDVSKIMVRNQLRRLPVIAEDELIGVVTQFDILGFLSKGKFSGVDAEDNLSTRVQDIMEKSTVSVSPDQDLAQTIELVKKTNFGGFPVVVDGKLAGIITTTDIIQMAYGT